MLGRFLEKEVVGVKEDPPPKRTPGSGTPLRQDADIAFLNRGQQFFLVQL